jgi:hypothetical protein
MRYLPFLAGALLLTAACGATEVSTPTSPTPLPPAQQPANIAGAWTGTSDFLESQRRVIMNISMTINQNDHLVSGTWELVGRAKWQGTISGTLTRLGATTEFNGRASFVNVEHPTGTGVCNGDVEFRGTVTDRTMRFDSLDKVYRLDNCPDTYASFAWIFNR